MLVGTAITGTDTSPATTLGNAPSIPATTMTTTTTTAPPPAAAEPVYTDATFTETTTTVIEMNEGNGRALG